MVVDVDLKDLSYKVFIDEDIKISLNCKVVIISNVTVWPIYRDFILKRLNCIDFIEIVIEDGEEYKNFDTVNEILEKMFIAKIDRKSTIISVGGGVVSDIAGFVASIYQRGIDFINISTTLLSQIDAGVGGKTGVNNKFGKNLIGTFYQPKAVFSHTFFLKTLPLRQMSAGIAEAIKMAIMFSPQLFYLIKNIDLNNCKDIGQVIFKCVQLKANIVSKDEKESGIRAVLNYGHTFAHVIENQTSYSQFLHGEAVAIGMNMANTLALNLGLISSDFKDEIKDVLKKFNLPVDYKIGDIDKFYESFFLDKKSANSKINFILPKCDFSNNDVLEFNDNFVIISDIDKDIIYKTLQSFS